MPRSVGSEAKRAVRELRAQARPAGAFDASRYFRTTVPLEFFNVRTSVVRTLGKAIAREHRDDWTVRDAIAFADMLIRDPHLEVKGAGLETLACFRRDFTPSALATWKRWLSSNQSANWATTDTICGLLISPLLQRYPELVRVVCKWTAHRNMWVRRAAAVSLVRLAARGQALDAAYDVATALRDDEEDLIHKASGWLLRECGRTDPARLKQYLLLNGPAIPRTTLRYAIERFAPHARAHLLDKTRRTSRHRSSNGRPLVKSSNREMFR